MSRLSSEISGALGRLGFAVGGAVVLGLALTVILTLVDRAQSSGNPDAGQRGVLGIWIGLPVGWSLARRWSRLHNADKDRPPTIIA